MSNLNQTPRSDRFHIAIFGRRNSGKSSLINAITGQNTAIVSECAGTTADPVFKSMEIKGIGPCVIIDTAGFDDAGVLGDLRVEKTERAAERTECAVIVMSEGDGDFSFDKHWIEYFNERHTPILLVVNKADLPHTEAFAERVKTEFGLSPFVVSAKTGMGVKDVIDGVIRALPADFDVTRSITGGLVGDSDVVLLVMPQDIQAPKGRLILPQVQTLRELLDKKCIVVSCTGDRYEQALAVAPAPKLIITDSQIFGKVYDKKPANSLVTSFSTLFAAYKGDIDYFVEGAKTIDLLTARSRVLIAEACTHAPLAEDIGREQIPRYLRQRFGDISIDIVSGPDFPDDLSPFDLIIHCGACMFNRKYVLSRVDRAKQFGVPMTNYGLFIAAMAGILEHVVY